MLRTGLPLPPYQWSPSVRQVDRDSEALVVLTDDGRLQHRIADPRRKLKKSYWVHVEGEPDYDALARLRKGVLLKDGITAPAEADLIVEPPIWPRTPPIRIRATSPLPGCNLPSAKAVTARCAA